ncbi:Ig-like domain repeat protein, partial [Candidatus Poribacteria bacterium]|nr:Ig-like domain repeat protein [Candidatus Poribacteria bacterium]
MSKNKDMYGAACKSQPIPNPSTELTENLPETKWKAAQKQSIKKANFLFFLSFISLVILTMPTTLWADLISLTVDSGGDNVFRGGVDRLRIIFTVDDSDDEYPYVVDVQRIRVVGENRTEETLGVIDRGTVSADETVNVFWDGTIDGAKLPDGPYTIRVTVDDDQEGALTATATLDSRAPRVSGVFANNVAGTPITDGSFISEDRLESIVVTGADDGGADNASELDLANRRNTIFLRNAQQAVVQGTLNYEGTALTFTLVDPLDDPSENGTYTLILILIDKAGNVVQSLREFTFDNVNPRLRRTSTNRGGLIPGAGVSQRLTYVEATLTDNLEDGIDLFASTIYLNRIGTDGPTRIPGEKVEDPENNKIRWELFTPLLGRDASDDGEYTIAVTAVDKAGNEALPVEISFRYDNRAPEPVSVSPMGSTEEFTPFPNTNYYNSPITGFVVDFGGTETDVDLAGRRQSTQIVFGTPKESVEGVNVLEGQVVTDTDNGTLTYILNQPIISRDGTQDGHYLLNLQATDTAGNTKIYDYQIVYDTQPPTLVSTTPASNETVSELSQVEVKLNEKTSGINFVQSNDFQLWKGRATDVLQDEPSAARAVPVNITSNGMDTVTLTLLKPIALDGSDDGTYTIKVTPTDRAGNIGGAAVREFYLVSQKHEPEIRLTMPETTTVNSLPTVVVELVDYVGAGIDFDASTVTVSNPEGALVLQAELEYDEATHLLTWTTEAPVAPDGSDDGEYTITATFVDFTGKSWTRQFSFILDTQIPDIESVHVAIDSQPELSADTITTLTEGFSQIIVTFEDTLGDAEQGSQDPGNDVDFTNTVVELTGPEGSAIPNNISVYSPTQLAVRFVELIADGSYTLAITVLDRAGNTARGAVRYAFLLDTESPRITASSPLTLSEPVSYIGGDFRQFMFTIEDVGPADLFFESGNTVPTALTYSELTSQLFLTIVSPFAEDGSSDGEYTVKISLVDKAGNRTDSEHTVVYDSKVPQLSSVMLNTESPIVLEPQLIKMISETVSSITLQFEDATRIDFTNTVVALIGPGDAPDSEEAVPINISVDSFTQLTIRFVELMKDGSYTLSVTPQDVAGNAAQGAVRYAFLIDTEAPHITAPTPLLFNQQPVTYIGSALRQFQFAFTVEDVGPAELYLEEQTIEVVNADGVNIPVAVTYDELTSQIFLALPVSFPRDGSVDGEYTVKVSLVDKAGNRSDSEYTVVYDSKAPQLTSVVVNMDPPIELVPNRIAEIVESINSITIQFEEATYINFANTQITLMGPESTNADGESTTPSIPLTLEDDGVSQVTLSFLDLEHVGRYTLSVAPQDVAGNAAAGALNYTFVLDIPLPRVGSVVIGGIETGADSDVVYVNADNMVIGAFLLDPTETGLSFGSEGSYITVTEPDGTTIVPGATGSDGEDLIVWEPITLTSDGTTDGRYNVYVVPVDKAGRQGSTVYREFIYDTQEPEIITAAPMDLSQPVSYISQSLTQFSFTIADIGPADLELSDQKVTLRDAVGAGLVPAQLTNDTENQLFLTLDQPLPLDGSMDGEYTVLVELADKAKNLYTVE